jgi:hypothetical protein
MAQGIACLMRTRYNAKQPKLHQPFTGHFFTLTG